MQRVRTTSRVVVRTIRRDIALGLTAGKREELVTLARRFARGRKTYVDAYWHPRFFATVSDPRLRVVQSQRRAGWLVPDLSVHQNKVCLESSLALVRSSWSGTVKAAMRVVSRDKGWDSSRLWALATLRSVDQIQECLVTPLRLATRQQRRMRRLLLRVRGGKPRESGNLWFELDCNLYRPFHRSTGHFRGAWLAVTGTRPGHRVNVPLAGSSLDVFASRTGRADSRPNIRVVIRERVTCYVATRTPVKPRRQGCTLGLDKGLNTLLVSSDGTVRRPERMVATRRISLKK